MQKRGSVGNGEGNPSENIKSNRGSIPSASGGMKSSSQTLSSKKLTQAATESKMSLIMTPSFRFGLHTRRKSQPEIKTAS